MTSSAIDPITLELLQETFISVVREMRANLVATAYSSIIFEAHDFSCVLVDGDGQIVAQAEDNPSHIFPVPWSVREMFKHFGNDIHPGDVFLHNDPYTGGTHLNDIAMIFPVFINGTLALFPAVRAHWGDVGGTTPGSISGKSTEIFHDGVRIPIMKVANKGVIDRGVQDLLFSNMRVPRERRGDFLSTWGTCKVAERRIQEIANKYGLEKLQAATGSLLDRAERRMRTRIADLPDGEYMFEHYLDPARKGAEPVKVRAAITVSGDSLVVDFAGSSPQVMGPGNSGEAVAATGTFIVLKTFLDPGYPINHGNFRPIEVRVPQGSFLNAQYPASCAGSSEVRNAAISAVLGAMGQLVPETMAGDIKGSSNHTYISGKDTRRDDVFLYYEYPAGGTGGTAHLDGNSAVRNFAEGDFGSIQPAESLEHTSALLVERCEIRPDSCGAGVHRGGFGLRRDIRALSDGALLSIASDKNVVPPFGVNSGLSGAPNEFRVIRDGQEQAPSDTPGKVAGYVLKSGDIVSLRTSGGGGWGDPLDRETALVFADYKDGHVSAEMAESAFGVVIIGGMIDDDATKAKRSQLKEARQYFAVEFSDAITENQSRRRCGLISKAMCRLGIQDGDLVEVIAPGGPSLRAWVQEVVGENEQRVQLGNLAQSILRIVEGDKVQIRAI